MRRVVSALALALLAAACDSSPCQDLGEKLCACTGATHDTCQTQVEQQLKSVDLPESRCDEILAKCNAPTGADFCEWLLTEDGQRACGIAQPQPATP
jgi:hypothetical protein